MKTSVVLKPRLFEKTYALSQKGVYVFDIEKSVNKHAVARAVEEQFDVKVVSVNTASVKGKAKRTISIMGKRMSNKQGNRSDIKKAYVTLAEGNRLPFFDAGDEVDEKQTKLQEKIDQAAAKQSQKLDKAATKAPRKLSLGRRARTAGTQKEGSK